jgi:sugar O-acyltransferase (sialic acid O-acetyltransferase NeuD family)
VKSLWIVGGAGAALEAWAVHAALFARGETLPLAGFVTLEPQPEFDPRGHDVVLESEFSKRTDPASSVVVLALGSPVARHRAARHYSSMGFSFSTLVHPSVLVGPRVTIGTGSIVMAATVLETDVHLGEHCMINVSCSLAHECRVGSFTSLGPGVHLAGRVSIGNLCDLGVGAVVRPEITLGDRIVVGAGAAVVADHAGPATLAGVPARVLSTKTA